MFILDRNASIDGFKTRNVSQTTNWLIFGNDCIILLCTNLICAHVKTSLLVYQRFDKNLIQAFKQLFTLHVQFSDAVLGLLIREPLNIPYFFDLL